MSEFEVAGISRSFGLSVVLREVFDTDMLQILYHLKIHIYTCYMWNLKKF
jgi:hypothetical protein